MGGAASLFGGKGANILFGAGLGLEAYGALSAGKNAARRATEAAENNDLLAKDSITRGQEAESMFRTETGQILGTLRAREGASGVVVGSGSGADVETDTAYTREIDAMTIRNNATREAWGYRKQADNAREEARLAKKEGRRTATATILSGLGSLGKRYGYDAPIPRKNPKPISDGGYG